MLVVLAATVLLTGCTALADDAGTMAGNLVYSPPDSYTLTNQSETVVSWRSGETGTMLNLLVVSNQQSGSSLIENFGQQWSPATYIGSWFQAGNQTDVVQQEIGGRTWLQSNVTGQQDLLLAAHLTADDHHLYQFFLVGDRSAVAEVYPDVRASLANATFR